MKPNKLLLLLSASLLLASCGGGNSSSSSSSATSQESSTSEQATSQESSEQDQSSSEEESFVPDAKKYGVLLGTFNGTSGILTIEMEKATLFDESGEQLLELKPKAYGFEEQGEGVIRYVEYENGWRIHLSAGEYKFVELDKLENGSWVNQDIFMPDANAFAGAYNLLEPNSLDRASILRLYGAEYDPLLGGYPVRYIHRSNFASSVGNSALRTFFYLDNGEYVVAADEIDFLDGEYYGYPFTVSDTGLCYVGDEYDSWFPDYSLLGDLGVDGDGVIYNYGLEEEYDGVVLYDYDTYDAIGTPVARHDDYGFYFEIMNGDEAVETFRFNADRFSKGTGDNETDYAPIWTFYSNLQNETRTFSAGEDSVSFLLDIDWDTWAYYFSLLVNGEEVEGAKLLASSDGNAYATYNSGEATTIIVRGDEYSCILINSSGITPYYDMEYLLSVYQGNFYTYNNNVCTEFAIFEDATYSINGQTPEQGHFAYSEEYESVVFYAGESQFAMLDDGFFALLSGEDYDLYLTEEVMLSLAQDFYGLEENGSTLVFSFDQTGGFSYRGNEAQINDIVLLDAPDIGYTPALSFASGEKNYYLVSDFLGAIEIYENVEGKGMEWIGAGLCEDEYFEIARTFHYYSEEYGLETFALDPETGIFYITTADEGKEPEEAPYSLYYFAHGEDGEVSIIFGIEVAEGSYMTVPFTYSDDMIISPTGYNYLLDTYYFAQGVWYGDGDILVVDGTTVTFDGVTKFDVTARNEGQSYILEFDDEVMVFERGNQICQRGEELEMNYFNFNVEDWIGEYSGDADNSWELAIDEVTGQLTCYKNGEFFWNNYSFVLVEGEVCLQFKTLFGTATFSIEGGIKTVTHESGMLPPPPPPVL